MKALQLTQATAPRMARDGWGYLNGFLVNHFRPMPPEALIPRPMPPLVRTQSKSERWTPEKRALQSEIIIRRNKGRARKPL